MFRLSALRLRVLQTCRLRYRYQYVDRVKARLRVADTTGSLVHNLLSDFFAKVPPEKRTESYLIEEFQRRWEALSPRYLRIPGVEALRTGAVSQLRRFARIHDLQAIPFMVEAYFQVRLAPNILLFGRIDRIDEEPDGSLHVIDYKTGEHPEEVDALQLRLYAIMVEKQLPRRVSLASFWYLEDGRVWTKELSEEDKRLALEETLQAVREMQTITEFPPTIAPHCAHCPYLHICEYRDEIRERRAEEGW